MMKRSLTVLLVVTAAIAAIGCSSSSGGAGGSAGSGGGGDGTFSCTETANNLCTQLLVPSSGVSAEMQTCKTIEMGTSGTGCSTTGLVGCCKPSSSDPSQEEQCYYSASDESVYMNLCSMMGRTWSTSI
jgi:hypothetical protein